MSVDRGAGPDPAEEFARLATRFGADPDVTHRTGFGSSPGLGIQGRIFAMLSKDELVLKLPRERVDQLVAHGAGSRFDPGHGRIMKEWVTLPATGRDGWQRLADEAIAYVRSTPSAKRR